MTAEAQRAGPVPSSGSGPSFHAGRRLAISDVVMSETIGGVTVTMRLPNRRFIGVAVNERADDPSISDISLLRVDGAAMLLRSAGDADVVAEWRAASRAYGLPMVMQRPDGGVIALETMFGPLMFGKVRSCRRFGALTRPRRPRFLTRRRTARLPAAPVVHRGGESSR